MRAYVVGSYNLFPVERMSADQRRGGGRRELEQSRRILNQKKVTMSGRFRAHAEDSSVLHV